MIKGTDDNHIHSLKTLWDVNNDAQYWASLTTKTTRPINNSLKTSVVAGADFHTAMMATAQEKLLTGRRLVRNWTQLQFWFFVSLWKSTKLLPPELDSNMHQIICRLGLRPRLHWGSLQRSLNFLAVLRGLTSKASGGERRKGKEREEKRRGGSGSRT